jgi:AcrR family transcriptional regulator
MEVKERILDTALKMFRTYGMKSVTMFDIARDCGISKKTVYEHFTDKQALVKESMQFMLDAQLETYRMCQQSAQNAIEELVIGLKNIEWLAKTVNPVMLYEVEKYHPETWKAVQAFRRDGVLQNIKENLRRGIAEGLYRSDLKADIVARMRQLQLESAFDPTQYPADQYSLHEVMYQVSAHYILGIATLKGHKLVNQYLQINETD